MVDKFFGCGKEWFHFQQELLLSKMAVQVFLLSKMVVQVFFCYEIIERATKMWLMQLEGLSA